MTAQKFTDFSISSILGDKKNTGKRTKAIADYKHGDQDSSNRAAKMVKHNTGVDDYRKQASDKIKLMNKSKDEPKVNDALRLSKNYSIGLVYTDNVKDILKILPENTDYTVRLAVRSDHGPTLVIKVSISDLGKDSFLDAIYGHLRGKVVDKGSLRSS